ncbi:hypothetical protein OUZ56_020332 [Daphnia magna]|uniref:Uncharacterized protein n=1 Tax=Daphnia magna TaxID=35525 RepID=A0ABQ9ZE72_9CRUS|nr:hypothetical protein OUZ56_020332 [Daphnia magna]
MQQPHLIAHGVPVNLWLAAPSAHFDFPILPQTFARRHKSSSPFPEWGGAIVDIVFDLTKNAEMCLKFRNGVTSVELSFSR